MPLKISPKIDKLFAISAVISLLFISANSAQNSSLPALSERANGVNSRYLSAAASTASLAAATVAAANAVPQGGSGNSNGNGNNNNQDRNYLLHQQQHLQTQSQQQAPQQQTQVNAANNQLSSPVIAGNPQQQTTQQQQQQTSSPSGSINNLFSPQYNGNQQQQQQLLTGTPVMSTTYTFNPNTGQFVPTELATGSSLAGISSNPLVGNNGYNNQFFATNLQQQQPFQGPFVNNAFNQQQQQQHQYNRPLISSHQQQQQAPQRGYNPQYQPYYQQQQQFGGGRQNNQFNRRTGFGPSTLSQQSTSASRFAGNNNNNLFNQQQQNPSTIEDDSGFFQQQVANSGGLVNGINNLIDQQASLDGSMFGSSSPPGNSYLINNGNQLHSGNNNHQNNQLSSSSFVNGLIGEQASLLSQSSSSISPIALPNPTTTFNTAYSSPNGGGDQCVAADNRHGTCYQASECIKRGGTPMGKCGSGSSGDYSGSSYVCCLFDVTCGQFAAERFVYFRNPNHPNTFDQSKMCRAKIGKLDKGTCQFRLDMIRFDVAKPTNGNCSNDMFVVSGQNENYVIPKICGLNDGQHYYVGVDESGVITLHMMMMGYYRRSFEILITQIPCRSDYAAPAHCLQYFMGTHGTIKSFNYDDDHSQQNYDLLQQQSSQQDLGATISLTGNPTAPYGLNFGSGASNQLQQRQLAANRYGQQQQQSSYGQDQYGGYPNDLDYTMCIRKESGFCSITYQLSRNDQGLQPFAVGHSIYGGLNNNNDTSLGQFASASGWHPVSTECRDDYLLIGGVRLCSGSSATGNPFPLVGGGFDNSPASIQFAQNGSVLNSAGIGAGFGHLSPAQQVQLQQQLQNQLTSTMQQLSRIQQQQQASNVSYANGGGPNNNNSAANNQQLSGNANNGANTNNLDQQQAALIQQSLLLQQQLSYLSNSNSNNYNSNRFNPHDSGQFADNFQSSIITDNTPGPFILRFVSNLARNARGFHIDYRQNPCK